MGRPVAEQYKFDLSHQEMDRLLDELEQVCKHTPAEWLTCEAAASWLTHDLGYEDQAEFEDALNGTFEDFVKALPLFETKVDERGRLVFKMKPEPPQEQWQPKKFTLRITDRQQLWNVCLKSPYARVEIPELEFEISADNKRKIDSIYNHIASAVFNLGTHVRQVGNAMSEDHKTKIMDCVISLNALLDVESPWTWVVHDSSGLSDFSDMSNVEVVPSDEVARPGLQARLNDEEPQP